MSLANEVIACPSCRFHSSVPVHGRLILPLSFDVAARQHHSSLAVLWATEARFLMDEARRDSIGAWWREQSRCSEHPEG